MSDAVLAAAAMLAGEYRVVDLSALVTPGVLKVSGHYQWGKMQRKFELRQFIAPGPHFMNFVEAETHVGTHVEVPAHVSESGKSAADLPLSSFFGSGILFRFTDRTADTRELTPADLEGVRSGDIVLIGGQKGKPLPNVGKATAQWLADKGVKMIGIDDFATVDDDAHHVLLPRDIPIIEQLANLQDLKHNRFLFFALPLRVKEMDSSWIRAMALEPVAG
jgi:kynurenine formamidase